MLKECIDGLRIKPDGFYLDCTVGGAGHSSEIAKRLTTGRLICLDKDKQALAAATEKLSEFSTVQLFHSDFKEFKAIQTQLNIAGWDGILLDLGVSSHQLDTGERGFSYMKDGPLDMRMDQTQPLTAAEIINNWKAEELLKILYQFGEEEFASSIVRNIVKAREIKPITTTFELVDIIDHSVPARRRFGAGHSAKKTFQALRIATNGELSSLEKTITSLARSLNPKGRLVVLTFHSIEDRIVKTELAQLAKDCICPPEMPICTCGHKHELVLINKKPFEPSAEELASNSRSRSAKLRIAERV